MTAHFSSIILGIDMTNASWNKLMILIHQKCTKMEVLFFLFPPFNNTACVRVSVLIRGCKKVSRLWNLGISRPTYCLTSCSSVVRVLVCQLCFPGLILAVSLKSAYYKKAAAIQHHLIVIYMLTTHYHNILLPYPAPIKGSINPS